MRYFKNKAGNVFAYTQAQLDTVANIGNPDYELPIPQAFYDMREKLKGMTALTGDELDEHLNPTPTTEQLAEQGRAERDAALRVLDAFVSNPLRYAELTEEQKTETKTYRQELLDVPQQESFPQSYSLPKTLEWLN